jgi:phosphatidylglycerol:prolipoprotein diacylglycerol transferase
MLYAFRKYRVQATKRLQLLDEFSIVALYGWIFARVGCFCIHDHLGMPCSGNCMLAMDGPDVPRYDMALLEILALMPLAVLFYSMRHTTKAVGWYTAVLFIYYGIVRFFLDFLRATDIVSADVRYLGLTPGQYASVGMMVLGVWLIRKQPAD